MAGGVFAACGGAEESQPEAGAAAGKAARSAATVGLYKPDETKFYLRNATNAAGAADTTFVYGPSGQELMAVAGDWDGDGKTGVGLYNQATGVWYLRNANSSGAADIVFSFGPTGQKL